MVPVGVVEVPCHEVLQGQALEEQVPWVHQATSSSSVTELSELSCETNVSYLLCVL